MFLVTESNSSQFCHRFGIFQNRARFMVAPPKLLAGTRHPGESLDVRVIIAPGLRQIAAHGIVDGVGVAVRIEHIATDVDFTAGIDCEENADAGADVIGEDPLRAQRFLPLESRRKLCERACPLALSGRRPPEWKGLERRKALRFRGSLTPSNPKSVPFRCHRVLL